MVCQVRLAGPDIFRNLEANDVPYEITSEGLAQAIISDARLVARAKQDNTPVVLIVTTKSFAAFDGLPVASWASARPKDVKADK